MDEITRNKLRKRLLQYPGATEESVVGDQQGDLRHGLPTVMICQPDSNSLNGPVNGGRPVS